MELSVMIEGQQGLNWPRWQRLVRAAEDLGFYGLFRSDHFANPDGPYHDALELWVSLRGGGEQQPIASGVGVAVSFRDTGITALAGVRRRRPLGRAPAARARRGVERASPRRSATTRCRCRSGSTASRRGCSDRPLMQQVEPVSVAGEYYRRQGRADRARSPPVGAGDVFGARDQADAGAGARVGRRVERVLLPVDV